MIPINVPEEKTAFGRTVDTMPSTYLGLPMGTTKSKIEDMPPIMVKIERLNGCSSLISYSSRLQLVNSVLTPITTYTMCTLKVHKGVIDATDRARKQCLWRGNSLERKGGNLAAWDIVQKPKDKGGLGVINLKFCPYKLYPNC
jgi:hypothetical protein